MSFLTRSNHGAQQKLTPFAFPRPSASHPLTPPDTDVESFTAVPAPSLYPNTPQSELADMMHGAHASAFDTPSNRPPAPRKHSNLSYISSGIARPDQQQGRISTPRPATRWLVVVSPPPALALENVGALYLNQSTQASQTVLLPLFPSLSRQVSAIAREFSFPSTTGICVFLQMPEANTSFAPRLSEESWAILWSHYLFEDRTPSGISSAALPIAGRLEFDLDLRKARWYESWVSALRREFEVTPMSTSPSLVNHHGREDSRVTAEHSLFASEHHGEREEIPASVQTKRASRHIPRKLSLIENLKFDAGSSVRSLSRPASRLGASPPLDALSFHHLSPVPQEDEPKSAIKVLETKVENWRNSALFGKAPPEFTGAATNTPDNGSEEEGQELNLDDFAWSISSAGPPSDVPLSARSFDSFVQSIHIAHRAEGSVCLTPSTCTSWGPADYSLASPASSVSRLPSPDIAHRAYEYAPLTPSTATSWGPPVDWDDFPLQFVEGRVASIDIAHRAMSSRPCTPTTATSWGPPAEWPASPAQAHYLRTPDVGQRTFELDASPRAPTWQHVWPYSDAADRATWQHVWPYSNATERAVWELVWPYNSAADRATWQHVWPYVGGGQDTTSGEEHTWKFSWPYYSQESETQSRNSSSQYPHFNLYPAVYPHFDLYPAISGAVEQTSEVDVVLRATHPSFSIYPAVYPSFEIYPGHVMTPQEDSLTSGPVSVSLPTRYPNLPIYSATYPTFEIYPGHVNLPQTSSDVGPISVGVASQYPVLDIYPAVYPNLVIYPPVSIQRDQSNISVPAADGWYKLSVHYPHFDLYPAVYPYNLESIYPPHLERSESVSGQRVTCSLEYVYPNISIYAPVYPYLEIYPSSERTSESDARFSKEVDITLKAKYPCLSIYPPVYPNLCIYPEVVDHNEEAKDLYVGFKVDYPMFDIYPAVDLSTDANSLAIDVNADDTFIEFKVDYPNFNIYPAVYPNFDIYPSKIINVVEDLYIGFKVEYPVFNLYPAVYPNFDLYPSTAASGAEDWRGPIKLSSSYPSLNIYPALYPYFDIYGSGYASKAENDVQRVCGPLALEAVYPVFNLYPAVYPHFDIYNGQCASGGGRRKSRKTHEELRRMVLSQQAVKQSAFRSRTVRKTHEQLRTEVLVQATNEQEKASRQRLIVDTNNLTRQSAVPREQMAAQPSISSSSSSNSSGSSGSTPMRPSEIRRAASLNRPSRPPPADVPASVNGTSPLRRFPSMQERRTSMTSSPLAHSRSNSTRSPLSTMEVRHESLMSGSEETSPVRRKPRRDSIVLEKARHWGGNSIPETVALPSHHPAQLTMDDLSHFPMPPLPPLPPKQAPVLNRPISKIDRSKLPFH